MGVVSQRRTSTTRAPAALLGKGTPRRAVPGGAFSRWYARRLRYRVPGYDTGVTRTLVLWDIDYTLLHVGSMSAQVFAEAFMNATGVPMERLADLPGKTDLAIITETLRLNNQAAGHALVRAFASALEAGFRARLDGMRAGGHLFPGAAEVLRALAGHPDVIQSVLTGNMRPIAEMKLAAFGLDRYVELGSGAYGMDAATRPELVDVARGRAAVLHGEPVRAASTVLIGDTPHDVAAALESGARIVAVTSGSSDETALRAAGAETVLTGLADTAGVLRAILAGR